MRRVLTHCCGTGLREIRHPCVFAFVCVCVRVQSLLAGTPCRLLKEIAIFVHGAELLNTHTVLESKIRI